MMVRPRSGVALRRAVARRARLTGAAGIIAETGPARKSIGRKPRSVAAERLGPSTSHRRGAESLGATARRSGRRRQGRRRAARIDDTKNHVVSTKLAPQIVAKTAQTDTVRLP
jgi:hypothetical protein